MTPGSSSSLSDGHQGFSAPRVLDPLTGQAESLGKRGDQFPSLLWLIITMGLKFLNLVTYARAGRKR